MEEYSDKQYIALLEAKVDTYERAIEVLRATIDVPDEVIKEIKLSDRRD